MNKIIAELLERNELLQRSNADLKGLLDLRDEELKSRQEELQQAQAQTHMAELEKAKEEWKEKARELEKEIYEVRDDVVKREEEVARWKRSEEQIAAFVREVTDLQGELLAKDARVRELQQTLRERPEETQPQQLESARKEFHDVEQRFALVESSDLS
ncbi:hypothetical protein R1flu_008583 [Riccia fluitans]|uniref:Uncharacterized protein n=1 Tax=Riccia fluitans TaxID=41844 RepID=A0ABD1YC44_9MARC